MEHGPDFDDHRAAHRRDHNRDGAVRGAHDHAEHVHLVLPSRIAVDDRHQSVDHTAVQFGDVEFGDVEFGDVEFGNHLTQRGDRGRRARDTISEANTSNQHHPHAFPASDQLTVKIGARGALPADDNNHAAGRLTVARGAYAHDAVVILDPGGDSAALGGAITVALCGHWDHPPPCPLAPHHTDAVPAGGDVVRLRVLFATDADRETQVRSLIGQALASGRLTGPDGRVTTWTLQSSAAASVRPDEADHAARLVAS